MSSPRPADHEHHDLELVARIAAGDVAAHEAVRARDLIAECPICADVVAELRGIAAMTRTLPSAEIRAATSPAPRDFRLTARDAARLRPGGLRGFLSRLGGVAPASPRLGGALATLGLVGVIVSAGLPMFGDDQAAISLGPAATDARFQGPTGGAGGGIGAPEAPEAHATAIPGGLGAFASDLHATLRASQLAAVATVPPDVSVTEDTAREVASPTLGTPLLAASLAVVVLGLVLVALAGTRRSRIG